MNAHFFSPKSLVLSLFCLLTLAVTAPVSAQHCVDFDPIPPGVFPCCGVLFASNGVGLQTNAFQWAGGAWTGAGHADVGAWGLVPGGNPPNELWPNNVNVIFNMADYAAILGAPVRTLTLRYVDPGGNVNLRVNGVFNNVPDFMTIPNFTPMGGTTYTRTANTITITRNVANVNDFMIGGQELHIDRVCASP